MRPLETDGLRLMLEGNPHLTLINVLSPRQFRQQHIPGSINIPLMSENFVQQVFEAVGGLNAPLVVYCASLDCDASSRAAEKLEAAGFRNIYVYEGGVQAWEDSGLTLNALA